MKPKQVRLENTLPGHFKFYEITVLPVNNDETAWDVRFAYGRIGTAPQTGTKVKAVGYHYAMQVCEKLISEKKAKGYKDVTAPVPAALPPINMKSAFLQMPNPGKKKAKKPIEKTADFEILVDLYPQLLKPIEVDQAETYIQSLDWMAQEKYNGQRMILCRSSSSVFGINKLGNQVELSKKIAEALLQGPPCFTIDTEIFEGYFYAFDLLQTPSGLDIRKWKFESRVGCLEDDVACYFTDKKIFRLAYTARSPKEKKQLFEKMREQSREGIVFKRAESFYTAGRGPEQLKLKFKSACSVVVAGINEKRSIRMALLDEDFNTVPVGSCSIPVNHELPGVGDVAEIEYLYAYPGGSLFQPVYLGRRMDVMPLECRLEQLKYKTEEET